MNHTGKFKIINVGVYDTNVYLFWMVQKDNKKFFQKCIKKLVPDYDQVKLLARLEIEYEDENWLNCGGICFINGLNYGNIAVFMYKPKSYVTRSQYIGLLSHELNHASFNILDNVGVKYLLEDKSHEAFTYLQGYLMKESLELLLK